MKAQSVNHPPEERGLGGAHLSKIVNIWRIWSHFKVLMVYPKHALPRDYHDAIILIPVICTF